jgi:hypothetical protein
MSKYKAKCIKYYGGVYIALIIRQAESNVTSQFRPVASDDYKII